MKVTCRRIKNEEGSATLIAIISMLVLTVIGLLAISDTTFELQIAGNERISKIAFFAAEAGKGYVAGHPCLYGSKNTDPDADPFVFPLPSEGEDLPCLGDAGDPIAENGRYNLGDLQSFEGTVKFDSSNATRRNPPRGSGFSVGAFSAYVYVLDSTGYGPNNAQKRIEQGFFRIGL